jgi:hypothetical protein
MVSSSYIVVRVSFLGRVVRMVVLGDFVRLGPQVCSRSKDTLTEVGNCGEDSHTWGCANEENRCTLDVHLFEVQLRTVHGCFSDSCALVRSCVANRCA